MDPKSEITGKRILVVNDEQDVLDTVYALLGVFEIDTALPFEEGKRLLEESVCDVAILGTMGVRGFVEQETEPVCSAALTCSG